MHKIAFPIHSRYLPEGLQGKFTCPASPNSALTRMVMMLVMMIGLWCGGSVSVWGQEETLYADVLVEIPQTVDADDSLACEKIVEENGTTVYTSGADVSVMFKMVNVDVKDCDYVVIKFAEPTPAGVRVAFWNHGNDNAEVPESTTEYKYVFADDPNCRVNDGIIPEISMLTLWSSGKIIKVAGVYKHYKRSYIMYVPEGVSANPSLVFSLHGASGQSSDYSPFRKAVADNSKDCIVVYPQGLQQNFAAFGSDPVTGWAATGEKDEDYYFFKAIIEEVKKKYTIDENRIYCCGFSNGGMMAYSLQNCASDIFAAFASISGYPINEMHLRHTGERPVPFLHIHGKADDFVKYSLMGTIRDNMVARNGCNPVPEVTTTSTYTKSVYAADNGGFPYVYYEVEGMGHEAYTSSTEDGNSAQTMWNFLSQYKLDDACDKTLKWSSNIDAEGFVPSDHGWKVTNDKTFVYGDAAPNENNVSHSLQFEKGDYQLRFETSGTNTRKISIGLVSPSGDIVFNKRASVGGKGYIKFSIPEYGEYTLTIIKESAEDKFLSLGAYMTSDTWSDAVEVTENIATLTLGKELLADDFKTWTTSGADATATGNAGCAYNIGTSTGQPYGDGNVYYLNYADLSNYSKLIITATAGEPRVLFNRLVHEGSLLEFPRDRESTGWETVIDNGDGTKDYVINLEAIVAAKGFAHLHAIKGANWQNVTVTDMFLVGNSESVINIERYIGEKAYLVYTGSGSTYEWYENNVKLSGESKSYLKYVPKSEGTKTIRCDVTFGGNMDNLTATVNAIRMPFRNFAMDFYKNGSSNWFKANMGAADAQGYYNKKIVVSESNVASVAETSIDHVIAAEVKTKISDDYGLQNATFKVNKIEGPVKLSFGKHDAYSSDIKIYANGNNTTPVATIDKTKLQASGDQTYMNNSESVYTYVYDYEGNGETYITTSEIAKIPYFAVEKAKVEITKDLDDESEWFYENGKINLSVAANYTNGQYHWYECDSEGNFIMSTHKYYGSLGATLTDADIPDGKTDFYIRCDIKSKWGDDFQARTVVAHIRSIDEKVDVPTSWDYTENKDNTAFLEFKNSGSVEVEAASLNHEADKGISYSGGLTVNVPKIKGYPVLQYVIVDESGVETMYHILIDGVTPEAENKAAYVRRGDIISGTVDIVIPSGSFLKKIDLLNTVKLKNVVVSNPEYDASTQKLTYTLSHENPRADIYYQIGDETAVQSSTIVIDRNVAFKVWAQDHIAEGQEGHIYSNSDEVDYTSADRKLTVTFNPEGNDKVVYQTGELKISKAYSTKATAIIKLTGDYLTPGAEVTVTAPTLPEDHGTITVSPSKFTVKDSGKAEKWFLVTYEANAIVAKSECKLQFSISDGETLDFPFAYERTTARDAATYPLNSVKGSYSFDWSKYDFGGFVKMSGEGDMPSRYEHMIPGYIPGLEDVPELKQIEMQGEYVWRNQSATDIHWQGDFFRMNFKSDGLLKVTASNTSGSQRRFAIKYGGKTYTNAAWNLYKISKDHPLTEYTLPVKAGDVEIMAYIYNDTSNEDRVYEMPANYGESIPNEFPQYFRVYKLEYVAVAQDPTITIDDNSEGHNGTWKVTLSTNDEDDEIYYTLDGSDPTSASERYTAPFDLPTNYTIKARTLTMGKSPSEIVTKNNNYSTASFSVSVPSGHGIVEPQYVVDDYIVGFKLRLNATSKMGYVFDKFTSDEAGETTLSTSDPYDYTIKSGTNHVYAWFKEIAQRTVTLNLTAEQKTAITAAGGDYSGYGYDTPMTLSSLSIPGTYTLYYPGHTLDYWYPSDDGTEAEGAAHYLPGKSYNEEGTEAMNLYAHFSDTENKFEYRANKVSIHWDFRTSFGSQVGYAENRDHYMYYNTHATIGSDEVDVPLKLSLKSSRIDNTLHPDWCTITEGTEIEIPSGAGAVFRFATYAPLEDNDEATLIGGKHFDSHTEATDDNGVKYYIYTYTTQSNDQTITLRIGDDFAYYKYLEADLPSADRVALYYESENENKGTVEVVAKQGSKNVDGVASTTDDGVYYSRGVTINLKHKRKRFYQFDHWEMCVDQEHGEDNWQTISTGSKYRTVEFTVDPADTTLTFILADYVHVRAVFKDKDSYYVNFSAGKYAEGLPPQQIHMEKGEKFTMPICNQTLFYRGNTLKYWSSKSDGSGPKNEYEFNKSYDMPEGVTSLMLYPVFELNKYTLFDLPLEISEDGQTVTKNDVEIVWNLTRTDRPTDNIKAGPTLNYQKSTGVLVAQLDFGGDKGFIDLPLYIDASADGAKVNNEANPTRCQVNAGTILGISALPQSDYYLTAADGMKIDNTTIGETNGTTSGVDVDRRSAWNAQTVYMSTYRRDSIVNINFMQESNGGYYKYVKAIYRHGYYWSNNKYNDGYWWVPRLEKATVDGADMADDLLTTLKNTMECTYEYDPNYTSDALPVVAATQNRGDAAGFVVVKQATLDNPTAVINVYEKGGILTHTYLVHFQKKESAAPILSSVTISDRDTTDVAATYENGKFVVSEAMNAHGTISLTFDHTMEELVLNVFEQRMKAESAKTLKFNYWNLADGEHTLSIPKSSLKDVYGEAVQKYVVDENETELGENVIIKFTVQDVPSTFTKTLVNYVVDDNIDSYAKANLDAAGIAHGGADDAFVQANADTGNNYFYIFVPEGEYQLTGNTKVRTSTDTNGKNPAKNDGSRIASVGDDVDNGLTKITRSKVSLVGQGKNKSVLWNKPDFEGITFTATIHVDKNLTDFYCQDMTLENRFTYNASIAGQKAKGTSNPAARAVVFWDKGSKSVLKNVSLKSYQDTYYSNNANADSRAYFENCDIYGVTDFICGDGDVWFEECKLVLRERDGADNILAAQQSTAQKWGYVFNNCTVEAENAASKAANDGQYTLGRPWNNSPAATYLHTTFKVLPISQGWSNMSQKTVLRLHEYDSENEGGTKTDLTGRTLRNTSPEAGSDDPILTDEQAEEYNLHAVTAGADMFNPTYRTEQRPKVTGVEFDEYDLRWNEDERALCYFIFRSDTEDGDFKLFAITLGGEEAKKTYYCSNVSGWYRVAAANERGGLGEMSAAVEFKQMDIYDLTLSRVYDIDTDVPEVVKPVGWSTICLPMNAKVPTTTKDGNTPEVFKVYSADRIEGNVMYLKAVDYMIGGQGYVVYGDPDNYTFHGTSRATEVLKSEEKCESLLNGYAAPVDGTLVEDMSAQGVNCYTLAYKPNISGIGFYKFNGSVLKPNRAWLDVKVFNEENNLDVESQNLAIARGIIFVFEDDEKPTTIGKVEAEDFSLYPDDNNLYDLSGRRVLSPEKGGVYIWNRRKVKK